MASGSTARPRVFNGDAQNACWEGWEVFTVEVTLVPSAQHVAPSGDCSSLRVAAQTWTCSRLTAHLYVRSLNIGGFKRTTSGGLRLRTYCTDLPHASGTAEAHLTVKNERDLVIVLVGRRRRVPFDREIRQAGGD